MKDYLGEFKKQKVRKNAIILFSAFSFAFLVNGFLFGTPVGTKLQTSVKNATTTKTVESVKSDIYIEKQGTGSDIASIKIGTEIKNVNEIRFSLITNPDESLFKINNIFNDEDKNLEIMKISNTPGITTLTFKFKNPTDIKESYKLADIVYTKKSGEKIAMNLTETVFVSGKDVYELSSSSLEF